MGQCLQYLERQDVIDINIFNGQSKPKTALPVMTNRRCFTLAQQRLVIYLRFRSLDNMDQQWHTPNEVFKRTGIRASSQWKIIKRWVERGFKVVSHLNRRGHAQMLSYQ